jgi:hypothetical protein
MLLSALRSYVEAMGGTLELDAQFPDRRPMVIDQITETWHDRGPKGKSNRPENRE